MKKQPTEVIVIGAGPVGLFTALCLAEQGIDVEVYDEQWRTTARSYALALHPGSSRLLSEHGLAGKISEAGHRVETVGFYDRNGRRAGFSYAKLVHEHPYLLIVPQYALESLLEQRLAERKVKVHWNHRLAALDVNDKGATAQIEVLEKYSTGYSVAHTELLVEREIVVEGAYVVGADGHRSAVRRKLDIPYEGVGTPEVFAVYEFHASPSFDEVAVVFGDGLGNILWPMRDGRHRWGFQLKDTSELEAPRVKARLSVQVGDQAFPHLDESGLNAFVAERAAWFKPEIREVFWSLGIRFDRRLASSFGRGRGWLAGDSAHLAAPVGMHSMNVGLREGRDLALALSGILKGSGKAADLDRFNGERLDEWRQLLGLEGAPSPMERCDPWVRERLESFVPCTPASGPEMRYLLAQLGLDLPKP